MTETQAFKLMKSPRDTRWVGHHHGGVMMIKILNACDLDCKNCTAAVGLAKKHKRVWFMKPDQFRTALESLAGWPQMIALFGGNPCISPHFEEICAIFRELVPDKTRRGLWSNRIYKHGKTCRETFHGPHCNINVHRSKEAYQEIRRDWPEAKPFGHNRPSMHGSWWTAIRDLVPDEGARWDLISRCFVNQTWSAEITLTNGGKDLRAFWCEFAATMAEYADLEGKPALGMPVVPGWWNHPIEHYAEQIRGSCHDCGAPLNPRKIEDLGGGPEDFTATHSPVFLTIKGRPSVQVESVEQVQTGHPATCYV